MFLKLQRLGFQRLLHLEHLHINIQFLIFRRVLRLLKIFKEPDIPKIRLQHFLENLDVCPLLLGMDNLVLYGLFQLFPHGDLFVKLLLELVDCLVVLLDVFLASGGGS